MLRHVGMVDSEPCTITEFKEVRINPPLSDLDFEFAPPPDAVVARQVDQLVRIVEMHGVDLTDIDRKDVQAVQSPLHNMMGPDQPSPWARLIQQKAMYVPMGDATHDEAAARGKIRVRTPTMTMPIQQATTWSTSRGGPEATAAIVVDEFMFLSSDEAVEWFSAVIDSQRFGMVNGQEGRAVLVGDRWLIEHTTIANLLGMAEVVVPTPEE